MKRHVEHLGTPQSAPLTGTPGMVQDRAGGWVFEADELTRLRRFLVLGSDNGTYYATARELTREAATCIDRMLEGGAGMTVLDEIVDVSESGRAPSNEPAILALALCLKIADNETVRRAAAWNVTRVCRTVSHLASLVTAIEVLGGWGPLTRAAVNSWIETKSTDDLAYQAIKYGQRQGWRLGDIMRLSHPSPPTRDHAQLFDWILSRQASDNSPRKGAARGWVPPIIEIYEQAQDLTDVNAAKMAALIEEGRLPWEAVPSHWSGNLTVQSALFANMPITATLRQLARLTAIGLLTPDSNDTEVAVRRLTSPAASGKRGLHPMAIYMALKTYAQGHGQRGRLSWQPVPAIVGALESAFFAAFKGRQPSRQKMVIGVDCSGSMFGTPVTNALMHANQAAAVMAYLQSYGNPNARVVAFSTYARPVEFAADENLAAIESAPERWGVRGGTDCSQPMAWALENAAGVEAFTIWTDEETWAGTKHPIEALVQYRERHGIWSKMVVGSLVSHGYQLSPPDDAGTLQVVGLDAAAPRLVDEFLSQPLVNSGAV